MDEEIHAKILGIAEQMQGALEEAQMLQRQMFDLLHKQGLLLAEDIEGLDKLSDTMIYGDEQ